MLLSSISKPNTYILMQDNTLVGFKIWLSLRVANEAFKSLPLNWLSIFLGQLHRDEEDEEEDEDEGTKSFFKIGWSQISYSLCLAVL